MSLSTASTLFCARIVATRQDGCDRLIVSSMPASKRLSSITGGTRKYLRCRPSLLLPISRLVPGLRNSANLRIVSCSLDVARTVMPGEA